MLFDQQGFHFVEYDKCHIQVLKDFEHAILLCLCVIRFVAP